MYYFSLAVNIIGLILGCMMLMSPVFTLTTIRYFASAYLILLGIDAIVMAVSRVGRRLSYAAQRASQGHFYCKKR